MEELKRLRTERGWSQQKLADVSGVNKATINQVEQGKRSPSIQTLENLARAMGAEVGDFFPKAQASLLDLAGERRESKLPDVADMLLRFGEMLLLQWEAELPDRAEADDDEWLANIVVLWRMFGLINYGVLDELGPGGIRDMGVVRPIHGHERSRPQDKRHHPGAQRQRYGAGRVVVGDPAEDRMKAIRKAGAPTAPARSNGPQPLRKDPLT